MNQRETIRIFVNGILTLPGWATNWTARAVTYCQLYRRLFADDLEYLSLPTISRWLFQRLRADNLRRKIQSYLAAQWDVVLVGHSNGADVILDCLRDMNWPRVKELHLISPACESDFDLNGLNQALRVWKVGHVFVYVAGADFALRLAGTRFARFLGYGTLGRTGPRNVDKTIRHVESRVTVIRRPKFGHGTWFNDVNFNDTMSLVLRDPDTLTFTGKPQCAV